MSFRPFPILHTRRRRISKNQFSLISAFNEHCPLDCTSLFFFLTAISFFELCCLLYILPMYFLYKIFPSARSLCHLISIPFILSFMLSSRSETPRLHHTFSSYNGRNLLQPLITSDLDVNLSYYGFAPADSLSYVPVCFM